MIRPLRIIRAVGEITRIFSFAFLGPALVSLAYDDWDTVVLGVRVPQALLVFVGTAVLAFLLGQTLRVLAREADDDLLNREGYLTVSIGWLWVTALAALPFIFSGVLPNPLDAFFEAMSGLTTTGASAIAVPLETVAPSVLFWRALMNWLGGIGIIVLFVAIISGLTQGGINLFQAEASGHLTTRLRPKIVETARVLWRLYATVSAGMVAVYFLLMLRIGMGWKQAVYDAVYHTFATFATGGFSNHSASLGYYDDVWIEMVTVVFMLIGGTNFTLLLGLRRGDVRGLLRDAQWRFMMTVFFVANAAVVALLMLGGSDAFSALRGSLFSVATTLTGTGLVTVDYSVWPSGALLILLVLMLIGGNAGSTSGALKSVRFVIMAKVIMRELRKLLHPRAVIPIRLGGRPLSEAAVSTTTAFMGLYIGVWTLATLVIVAVDPHLNVLDGASATASTLGNVGVGIGAVGPTGSYAVLHPVSKAVLAALMWFGRLELFTALLLFYPSSWRG